MNKDRRKKFLFTSFSKRLFAAIFTTSLLLLAVGIVIIFDYMNRRILEESRTELADGVSLVSSQINSSFEKADSIANLVFSQPNAIESSVKNIGDDTSAFQTLRKALITAISFDGTAESILFVSSSGYRVSTATLSLNFLNYTDWINHYNAQKYSFYKQRQTWYFLQRINSFNEFYFTNFRIIKPILVKNRDSILAINFKEKNVEKLYDKYGDKSCIVYRDGTVISAKDPSILGTETTLPLSEITASEGQKLLFFQTETCCFSSYLPVIDSWLIAYCDLPSVNRGWLFSIILASTVTGLLLSALLSRIIAERLTRPLTELKNVMQKVREGDTEVRSVIAREDEFGFLSSGFNQVMDSMNIQMKKIEVMERNIKERELYLLQSQINPHLLYNTIDSAAYLVTRNDTVQSAAILDALSRYYKSTLQNGNRIVKLSDSFDHIAAYLDLQNKCRQKDFSLEISCPDELLEAKIMHMLLQPIVENSVLHGFDGMLSNGTINIQVQAERDILRISISDDGIGMEQEDVNKLSNVIHSEMPPDKKSGGYALWNISQRILMAYGNRYGVEMESSFGDGTTVTLTLPWEN